VFCNRCGTALDTGKTFCAVCGQAVPAGIIGGAVPVPGQYERERLARHLHLLAILWMVVAFLWLIPSVVLFAVGTAAGVVIPGGQPGAAIVRTLGPMVLFGIGGFLLLIAALNFAAGWGLLKLQPWARGLAIVLGAISLLHPPFGTALGIYTLWVLLSGNAGAEYERISNK
jgi:hypothetical protein